MPVAYRLVGYDKRTEMMAVRIDLPQHATAKAKEIAGIHVDDDSQVGDWELAPAQALGIAQLVRASMEALDYDFFLEPYVLEAAAWEVRPHQL